MRYRLDYYLYGRWVTWAYYDDKEEAEDDAYEHERVYGSTTRIVEVPKVLS